MFPLFTWFLLRFPVANHHPRNPVLAHLAIYKSLNWQEQTPGSCSKDFCDFRWRVCMPRNSCRRKVMIWLAIATSAHNMHSALRIRYTFNSTDSICQTTNVKLKEKVKNIFTVVGFEISVEISKLKQCFLHNLGQKESEIHPLCNSFYPAWVDSVRGV